MIYSALDQMDESDWQFRIAAIDGTVIRCKLRKLIKSKMIRFFMQNMGIKNDQNAISKL